MDTAKLAQILKDKRDELFKKNRPPEGYKGMTASNLWTEYLKQNKIRKTGVVGLIKTANKGQLQGKTIVQTDISLHAPLKTQKELEDEYLPAGDLTFYVMDREIAEKILVLGLP